MSNRRLIWIGIAVGTVVFFTGLVTFITRSSARDRKMKMTIGVQKVIDQEDNKARCQDGDGNACVLASLYMMRNGYREKAIRYLKKACGLNHPFACFQLGELLHEGDPATAGRYMKKACELDYERACQHVADQ